MFCIGTYLKTIACLFFREQRSRKGGDMKIIKEWWWRWLIIALCLAFLALVIYTANIYKGIIFWVVRF